jgi:hypothetical protein
MKWVYCSTTKLLFGQEYTLFKLINLLPAGNTYNSLSSLVPDLTSSFNVEYPIFLSGITKLIDSRALEFVILKINK